MMKNISDRGDPAAGCHLEFRTRGAKLSLKKKHFAKQVTLKKALPKKSDSDNLHKSELERRLQKGFA